MLPGIKECILDYWKEADDLPTWDNWDYTYEQLKHLGLSSQDMDEAVEFLNNLEDKSVRKMI